MSGHDPHAPGRFDALDRGGSPAARMAVRAAMLAVLGIGAWGVYQALIANRGDGKIVQTIELLGPTPPSQPEPPPPPEPELPEETEVELEAPPDEMQDQGPVDDRLGVDGEGGMGSDAFGLLAKRGGRDLTEIGDGDGSGLSLGLIHFAQSLRSDIDRQLAGRIDLRQRRYVVVVKLWIGSDGTLQRWELSQPPAADDLRNALESALTSIERVTQPPPGLPQPVWVRITSSLQS